MNDFQITCFLTVANCLNFARAAEIIGISQPAVTHQIKSLENELGSKLFNRTTRSVELTTAGNHFIPYARQMDQLTDTVKKRFSSTYALDMPVLRIGCHGPLELVHMTDLMQAMAFKFPGFHPQFISILQTYIYKLLEDDAVDIIFAYEELNKSNLPGTFKRLEMIPMVAVVHEDSELADRECITMEDLMRETLILQDPKTSPPEVSRYLEDLIGRHDHGSLHICEVPEFAFLLVRSGYGISVMAENIIPAQQGIRVIPLEGAPEVSFGMYYNPEKKDPVLKEFVKMALS